MRHAPVYFTIVQVRFNPIMALNDYAPKIQDRMRRDGFPDLRQNLRATFNLHMPQGGASPAEVPVTQNVQYTFANMAKTAGFLLDQGSLSFQTTEYDTFDTFSATFVAGLKVVHEIVGLNYVDRIGVRYLDAVYPQQEEELAKYLTESVLGLHGKLAGRIGHSFSETLVKFEDVTVIARTILQDGQIGLPPDLHPMWLVLSDRFRALSGFHATLDTDGSIEARTAFDLDDVAGRLKLVHAAVTTAFKATVTQLAIDSWE
jgi:uncharacterized protein (TIGR04255 family)